MSYLICKKCDYICKQKIDMQRHLEKKKKCIIINKTDKSEEELYQESLIFHNMLDGLNLDIKLKNKKFICRECNASFQNNSNLLRHKNSNKSCNNYNILKMKII